MAASSIPSINDVPLQGNHSDYCSYYRDLAEHFCARSLTQSARRADIEPWRKGRKRYWCWGIPLEAGAILERFERYQQRLSPFLLKNYRRQPHLTVAVCGFWQADQPTCVLNDNFTAEQLTIQLQRLASTSFRPFELSVLGGNSFAAAPFLEVVDNSPDNQLLKLRQCLLQGVDDFRSSVYCPHLTLGLYERSFPTSELHFLLGDHNDRQPLSLMVSSLSLMSYDARELGGPLTLERQVILGK